MKCPYCGKLETRVIDSRAMDDNTTIRRRRQCDGCEGRFTTYERVDTIPLAVVKRDGAREPFDRQKLLGGIVKSCVKRPVSMEQMENIVTEVENTALNSLNKEISSKEIGELVMEQLRLLDEVSYVRFASVYRQFKDIDTFIHEISKLLQDKQC